MNRQQMIERTLLWEQVAAAARAKAGELREQLTADATAELEEQGTAPTWRLPDVGTVTLPVSTETVYVADEAAVLAWVKRHYPEEVETLERVRPAFLGGLLGGLAPAGDVACVPLTGTVVPGVAVRPGGQPKALTFRPTPAAKEVLSAGAAQLVEDVERRLDGPVVLAELGGPDAA